MFGPCIGRSSAEEIRETAQKEPGLSKNSKKRQFECKLASNRNIACLAVEGADPRGKETSRCHSIRRVKFVVDVKMKYGRRLF